MFRVYLSSARRWNAPLRRWERHFVTGAQKRALQQNQVAPSGKEPPAPPVPPPMPMTDSNPLLLPIGIVSGVALAAGGAYYYYNSKKDNETPLVTEKETTPAKVAPLQPSVAAVATAQATPAAPPPKETSLSTGHRVTSIAVPPKMQNTTAPAAAMAAVQHPPDGNRVAVLLRPPVEPPGKVSDTASTHTAVAELQSATTLAATESLLQSHQSLWGATSDAMFPNADGLEQWSVPQLQARVYQLAAELKDRTKWEAIRLKEFLVMKEKETADKYGFFIAAVMLCYSAVGICSHLYLVRLPTCFVGIPT
jgi:hypothetical protein